MAFCMTWRQNTWLFGEISIGVRSNKPWHDQKLHIYKKPKKNLGCLCSDIFVVLTADLISMKASSKLDETKENTIIQINRISACIDGCLNNLN